MSFRTAFALALSAALVAFVYLALDAILSAVVIVAQFAAGVGLFILAYLAGVFWRRESDRYNRAIDGSFRLQRHKLPGGGILVIDPNKSISGAYVVHPSIGYREIAPAGGWELQARINETIQTTRSLAAIMPGDDAQIRSHGSISPPRLPANITKMLPKPPRLDERPVSALPAPPSAPVAAPVVPSAPPTFDRIAKTAVTKNQIALGYRWDNTQHKYTVAPWNPTERPILGILGSTRQGKTSGVGIAVASQLALQGWHGLILDPEREGTWAILAPWMEYHRTDHTLLIDQLAAVQGEYQRRGDIMAAHSVDDAVRLPPGVMPFFALIIEELGRLRETLPTAEKSEFDNQISNLVRVGGKRGMAIVVIDQHYKSYDGQWPAVLRQNALRLSYRQEIEDYNLVRVDGLSQLERGQFAYRGQIWRSWDARTAAIPLLSRQSLPKHPAIINGHAVRMESSPARSVAVPQEVDSLPTPPNAAAERSEETRLAIIAYLDGHPQATQADIRNALGTSKGYTHQVWHEWHNARNSQPAIHPATIPDALTGWRTVIDADDPSQAAEIENIRQAVAAGKISIG